jgi:hypothetical protein
MSAPPRIHNDAPPRIHNECSTLLHLKTLWSNGPYITISMEPPYGMGKPFAALRSRLLPSKSSIGLIYRESFLQVTTHSFEGRHCFSAVLV